MGITDTLAVIRGGARNTSEERAGLVLYFPDLDQGWKKDSMPDFSEFTQAVNEGRL
jgi:hypothetical protein